MSSAVQRRRPACLTCLVGLVVLLAAAAAAGFYAHREYLARLEPIAGEPRIFEVTSGQTVAAIAARLETEGLIRDRRVFELRARERDLGRSLQAGSYLLDPALGVDGLLDTLAGGKVATRKVTFPEGLHLEQSAARAEAAGFGAAQEYLKLATDEAESFGIEGLPAGASLLGYLYPDTYQLPLDAGPRDLIEAQVQRFVTVWREVSNGAPESPHSRHELVTMASLIEREVKADEERAKVAGVIENRLRRKMKLEFCSTVFFALGETKERLLYRDLQVKSPYNTYLHQGLPPGPIANPGRPSLAAALRPEQHDKLYFVLTAEGRHLFSRTGAEHYRAKAAGELARTQEGP